MRGDSTPPLVNTGNPLLDPTAGIQGSPTTMTLFGNERLGDEAVSGGRLTVGLWFSDAHYWGIEGSGFVVGEATDRFSADSLTGVPLLVRPIQNVGPIVADRFGNIRANPAPGQEAFQRLADPFGVAGSIDIDRRTTFWGFDINLKRGLLCCENGYIDLLFGYRQLGLDESLTITEQLTTTTVSPRQAFRVQDRFETTNRFYGGQIGFDSEYRCGRWSFGLRSKVALGNTQQMAELSGSTTRQIGTGMPMTLPGGLLVQSGTNMGRFFQERFSVVPEVGLTLGFQLCSWCRATVGYNFLYWNNVWRPGGAIDRGINTAYLPFAPITPTTVVNGTVAGVPARPAFIPASTDFWAQGLTLGLEFRW
jgi:hypothetical protein